MTGEKSETSIVLPPGYLVVGDGRTVRYCWSGDSPFDPANFDVRRSIAQQGADPEKFKYEVCFHGNVLAGSSGVSFDAEVYPV